MQRRAAVAARRAPARRSCGSTSIAITTPSTANAYHVASTCARRSRAAARSRAPTMKTLTSGEDRGLGERGEMLRLAVAELVRDVGRPAATRTREERQQRSDEVGAGVQRLGEEAEAVRREADGELERDKRRGGGTETSAVRRCGLTAGRLARRATRDDVLPPREEHVRLLVRERERRHRVQVDRRLAVLQLPRRMVHLRTVSRPPSSV